MENNKNFAEQKQGNDQANSDIAKALNRIAEVGQQAKNIEEQNKARTADALAFMTQALARFK